MQGELPIPGSTCPLGRVLRERLPGTPSTWQEGAVGWVHRFSGREAAMASVCSLGKGKQSAPEGLGR